METSPFCSTYSFLNLLALCHATFAPAYLIYARTLANTMHKTLGCTRDSSSRLPEASDTNLLGGGLRIGKEDESGPDGDGRYRRYLTLGMFARNRLSVASREKRWDDGAVALKWAIHPRFVYDRDSQMYWKMNAVLSRPLVNHEGNSHPVDGLMICQLLQTDERRAEPGARG